MNTLTHFLTLYKLSTSHELLMYTFVYITSYIYATCPLHYFLKARYDLPVHFLLRGFACILEHTGVGEIADVHHEKRKAARRCLYARCILVRPITLTKRRIACYFRCDLSPPSRTRGWKYFTNISVLRIYVGGCVVLGDAVRKYNEFILAA